MISSVRADCRLSVSGWSALSRAWQRRKAPVAGGSCSAAEQQASADPRQRAGCRPAAGSAPGALPDAAGGSATGARSSQAAPGPASFAATVAASSHDFRQVLQALALNVGALEHQLRDPQARETLADLRLAVATVDCCVEAVTGLAALLEGQAACKPADVGVAAVIDALVARLASERPGLRVFWHPEGATDHWVRTDARWLERALRQLVWRMLDGEPGEWLHVSVSGCAAGTVVELRRTAAPLLSVVQRSLFGDDGNAVDNAELTLRAVRPADPVRDAYLRLAIERIGACLTFDAGLHRARLVFPLPPRA